MDYPTVGDKECGTMLIMFLLSAACCIGCLLFAVSRVAAADDPLCAYFDTLATMPGVSVAEWIGYPEGWRDMPQTWDYVTWTPMLWPSGILTAGYKSVRYMWAFTDLDSENYGVPSQEGTHNFCPTVLVIDEK